MREKICREVQRVVNVPAFRDKNFTALAMEPIASSPDEFAQFLKTESVSQAELLKLSGGKPE